MQPDKHRIVPLSFVPAEGYAVFRVNDGNDPSELGFKLSADGEMIGLFDAAVMRFDYSDAWYPTTDGGGHSLHITDPTAHASTWDDAESWFAAMPRPAISILQQAGAVMNSGLLVWCSLHKTNSRHDTSCI
jgi:hypothetical protein